MKIKRFLSAVIAVVMLLVFNGFSDLDAVKNICPVQLVSADTSSNGDVNLDGTTDSQDLTQLKNLFLGSGYTDGYSYDVNDDGAVNGLDLVDLIKIIITPAPPPAKVDVKEYTFRNSTLLENHYQKHGIEMGFGSASEYEKAASNVVNSPDALHKKEKEDNDDVYYIEATNEFVVVSTDGFIRTYFKPSSGKAYYDRQ